MRTSFTLTFLLLLFTTTSVADNTRQQQYDALVEDIDTLIASKSPRTFNGVILITHKGKPIYQVAKGYRNFKTKTPLSVGDKFRIQSNSKQIAAVLILKQVETGKIDLWDPIIRYLPELDVQWSGKVTVHQLLNMTSGITSLTSPLRFEPGTDYYYSNPGYGLLGSILFAATGKSFGELANELFEELGLANTYSYEFGGKNNLIDGHVLSNGKIEPFKFDQIGFTDASWQRFLPAGGIVSTAADLNKWDMALHNGQILKESSYQKMVAYSMTERHISFDNQITGYGYGVMIDDTSSVRHIGHAGRGLGFVSIKFYIPEQDISVIMLENIYDKNSELVYHFERELRLLVLSSELVCGKLC